MSPPMPWWKRWPNRVRLALTALKYRVARWLHRWVLPSRTKASTDTMGDWKRIQALPDDTAPRLVRPKNGPYADLINRVRLYAQNGAKALAPLLDGEYVPATIAEPWAGRSGRYVEFINQGSEWVGVPRSVCWSGPWSGNLTNDLLEVTARDAKRAGDQDAEYICSDMLADVDPQGVLEVVTAAYNSPWTVKDGEVYEVVTEPSREETIQ